ncbi:MAG TPA: hypothetical protein VGX03_13370 [Candidatus Binatia bacterium]|nr:hypothetical protein [Candidatus Binatia bacterium]
MNILDEDISIPECERLRAHKIHFRQIGVEIGISGMKDHEEVIPLLHQLKRPTFFTLDHGFSRPRLLHPGYCLVFLDIWEDEAAEYIRRFLRHAAFCTRSQRMGKVVHLRHSNVSY